MSGERPRSFEQRCYSWAALALMGFVAWRLDRSLRATDRASAAAQQQIQRVIDAALLAHREREFGDGG